ncbi:Uncharacterised protein [Clostridium sporogenes]|nr:Uncharacterised protein [Clostridium sporogenes]
MRLQRRSNDDRARTAVRGGRRPRRSRADDDQGAARTAGRARGRVFRREGQERQRVRHRRSAPARRADATAAGLPGDDRGAAAAALLRDGDRRFLRHRGRDRRGAPRCGPRRRGDLRRRPVLLRLVHVPARPPRAALRHRGDPRRVRDARRHGRARPATRVSQPEPVGAVGRAARA